MPRGPAELEALANAWIDDDPDPVTRAELRALIEGEAWEVLEERFAGPLQFGTAGLRGTVGAGPGCMNRATVARAAAGLARQLQEEFPNKARHRVVVARDGRKMSPELAATAAEILAGHAFQVFWFDDPVPTPVAAFAGMHMGAAAVVVITASHNPPQYNGMKVFSSQGCQIVSPQDTLIRERADAAGPIQNLQKMSFDQALRAGRILHIGNDVGEAYLDALDTQCMGSVPPSAQIRAVTTALHGVGHPWVEKALNRRGFHDLHPVLEQAEPDGLFPTVAFPNPEEPGALDLALAKGKTLQADLIVANDPDTDRLCVAVSNPVLSEGFQILTGNEVGVLLADWLLRAACQDEQDTRPPFVATTVVSTMMLERIAHYYGADYLETLTGFKWIWHEGRLREADGQRFVFGFEEALGYSVGPVVRDKDGIGAAQVLMELASSLKAQGKSLLDGLDALSRTHGFYLSGQVATVLPGLGGRTKMADIIASLRRSYPSEIAGLPVSRTRDLLGADAEACGLPRSNVLTFWLGQEARLVMRPSGTEPKLKSYIEVRETVDPAETVSQARQRASQRFEAVETWVRTRVT